MRLFPSSRVRSFSADGLTPVLGAHQGVVPDRRSAMPFSRYGPKKILEQSGHIGCRCGRQRRSPHPASRDRGLSSPMPTEPISAKCNVAVGRNRIIVIVQLGRGRASLVTRRRQIAIRAEAGTIAARASRLVLVDV